SEPAAMRISRWPSRKICRRAAGWRSTSLRLTGSAGQSCWTWASSSSRADVPDCCECRRSGGLPSQLPQLPDPGAFELQPMDEMPGNQLGPMIPGALLLTLNVPQLLAERGVAGIQNPIAFVSLQEVKEGYAGLELRCIARLVGAKVAQEVREQLFTPRQQPVYMTRRPALLHLHALLDGAGFLEPPQRGVQDVRIQRDRAAHDLLHPLSNSVPMGRLLGEHPQHDKIEVRQHVSPLGTLYLI